MVAKPSFGTISRRIWDEAERLSKQFKRPASRAEVCASLTLADLHEKTVSTQYGAWKRETHPELDGTTYKPDKNRQSSPRSTILNPTSDETVIASTEVAERNADWTLLLKNGFKYLGDWQLTENGELTLERSAPKTAGVYAIIVENEVVYIGKTERTLHARLADYRRGHASQKTSSHIKRRILSTLSKARTVRVLVATPKDTEWNGLPVVTFHGLESGLIRLLQPEWNRQGKGRQGSG